MEDVLIIMVEKKHIEDIKDIKAGDIKCMFWNKLLRKVRTLLLVLGLYLVACAVGFMVGLSMLSKWVFN